MQQEDPIMIKIEIGGDTTKLEIALKNVNTLCCAVAFVPSNSML